ncbi:MAG: hypothetical protein Q8R98_26180, partial [Rubrivivax sp.]|nr:hypothetical protein [Rubrivivax sp.]
MCEPATIMLGLAAAGAATTAYSAVQQGKAAEAEGNRVAAVAENQAQQSIAIGNYQKAQAEADADTARGEAVLQAEQIRAASKRQRSAAIAATAGSGTSVSDGTAELINFEIMQGGEKDALTTILSGNTRARQIIAQGQGASISADNAAANSRAYGTSAQISGQNAKKAGYTSAATSALKFGSQAYGGWSSTAANPMSRYTTGNLGS